MARKKQTRKPGATVLEKRRRKQEKRAERMTETRRKEAMAPSA